MKLFTKDEAIAASLANFDRFALQAERNFLDAIMSHDGTTDFDVIEDELRKSRKRLAAQRELLEAELRRELRDDRLVRYRTQGF